MAHIKSTFAILFLALSLTLAMGTIQDAFAGANVEPCNNIAGFSNDHPCADDPCEKIPADVATFYQPCLEEETGSIQGQKYEDKNLDGDRDRAEPYLNGWTIFLDENYNRVLDEGEAYTITSYNDAYGKGTYLFEGLPLGDYMVCEAFKDNWAQTQPGVPDEPECYEVTLDYNGEICLGHDFGNMDLGIIEGKKYYDTNLDGDRDRGEPYLNGWTIFLDENDNYALDDGERSTITADNQNSRSGFYEFTGLFAGFYTICEVLLDDWEQTQPGSAHDPMCYEVTVDKSGQVFKKLDFGNYNFKEQGAELIIIKNVINNNGGTAVASDFTMNVINPLFEPDTNFAGQTGEGVLIAIDAGLTIVTEHESPLYTGDGGVGDCNFIAELGVRYTCIITNEYVAPPVECEEPKVLVDDKCVTPPVECEEGQVLVDDKCVTPPVECEEGQVLVDDKCITPPVECEEPKVLVDDKCITPPVECEEGVLVGERCVLTSGTPGGDNEWDTRPTFGVSHETRETMIVDSGFVFNDNSFTVTDNHHTPFDEQVINIGTLNTFAAKVYTDKDLMVQEFLFGIPDVGMGHQAEMRVEVWYDKVGEIQDVKVIQTSEVIDRSSLSITHKTSKCAATDVNENCDTTVMSAVFLEPLANNVMAIKAIDFALRDQTTYLNDGFDISGDSLNPMQTMMIPSPAKGEGLVEVVQNEKYSDYWSTQDGRIFEMNSFGSFKQANPSFERFADSGEVLTRMHSEFGKIVDYETKRALKVFDASALESQLPDSFSHDITISERITEEVLQEMLTQAEIAQRIIDAMDQQARWN